MPTERSVCFFFRTHRAWSLKKDLLQMALHQSVQAASDSVESENWVIVESEFPTFSSTVLKPSIFCIRFKKGDLPVPGRRETDQSTQPGPGGLPKINDELHFHRFCTTSWRGGGSAIEVGWVSVYRIP